VAVQAASSHIFCAAGIAALNNRHHQPGLCQFVSRCRPGRSAADYNDIEFIFAHLPHLAQIGCVFNYAKSVPPISDVGLKTAKITTAPADKAGRYRAFPPHRSP
jgi:hypothetical protein